MYPPFSVRSDGTGVPEAVENVSGAHISTNELATGATSPAVSSELESVKGVAQQVPEVDNTDECQHGTATGDRIAR